MLTSTCILLLSLVTTTPAEMEGYVVGGAYAKIHQHAHSAFLNIKCVTIEGETTFKCSASVVNQKILLSAAHCLDECIRESHIGINVGSENRKQGQMLSSFGFVMHEDYDYVTSANDICLIRTKGLIKLGVKVARVAIMKKPPYYDKASIAGWGYIDEEREVETDLLKFVWQQVWTKKRCIHFFKKLPAGTICAANNQSSSHYAALGDSGSALVVRGYIQIGIVAYKVPKFGKHVVVYTDVGYFFDWIQRNARVLACTK